MIGIADVIITLYKPDGKFEKLLRMLLGQTVKPGRIILMNTVKEPEFTEEKIRQRVEEVIKKPVSGSGEVEIVIESVSECEYDHGGTRHAGAAHSQAPFLIYMTQDAVPADLNVVEALLRPFGDGNTAAVYGRQLCYPQDGSIERFTHEFNYPAGSSIKTAADVERLGIKAYFCSNVCAAYRRSVYDTLGGFVRHTIFNEDMLMAAAMIEAGYSICYAAEARVYHSHRYSAVQQLKRNFDLGVSHRQYAQVFGRVKSESEGIRLVAGMVRYLIREGEILSIPRLFVQTVCKYAGYLLGKNYDRLPETMVRKISMNQNYWIRTCR